MNLNKIISYGSVRNILRHKQLMDNTVKAKTVSKYVNSFDGSLGPEYGMKLIMCRKRHLSCQYSIGLGAIELALERGYTCTSHSVTSLNLEGCFQCIEEIVLVFEIHFQKETQK